MDLLSLDDELLAGQCVPVPQAQSGATSKSRVAATKRGNGGFNHGGGTRMCPMVPPTVEGDSRTTVCSLEGCDTYLNG